ncbi:hypothetical protein LDENG_00109540 [Lucifuga dentata]|nr:hypothetical protein LDENG_00109540 [Lucifuga dentata]
MKRNQQVDIRGTLALAGTFTFLCSCAKGCIFPFLTLYFRQLGLTPAMTGIIMGTKHLIAVIWCPVASLLSRHYNKRRMVINGSLVCSAAVALILVLLPSAKEHVHTSCNMSDLRSSPSLNQGDYLHVINELPIVSSTLTLPTINTKPVSQTVTHTQPTTLMSKDSVHQHDHGMPHPLQSQYNVSVAVNESRGEPQTSIPVTDHDTTHQVGVRSKRSEIRSESEDLQGEGEKEEKESRFEFMGSLKVMDIQHQLFFLMLITVSVWEFVSAPLKWTADDGLYEFLDSVDASDRYGSTWMSRSAVHFYCYAGLAALALPVATFLPLYLNKKQDKANGLLKAMQLDEGSSELHMGICLAVALISQMAFPLFAGRLSKVLSPGRVLTLGAATLGLQCFYYSFLWGPWAVLPAQLFSCFSSGALWWAVRVQCEDVAMPGAERSVRRIYSTLSLDLGRGLGSFAGGFLVQRAGLIWLFRGVAVGMMAWCVCLPLLQWKAPRQRRINYSRLLAADASEASDSESEQERDWLAKAMDDERSNNNCGRRINH